jgi:hypothetical protein
MKTNFYFIIWSFVASMAVYAQPKPAHGNLSLHFGAIFGNTNAQEFYKFGGNHGVTGGFLGAEKHFGRFFSLSGEYGYAFNPFDKSRPFSLHSFSLVPTLNLRSNKRFVFSFGARGMWGLFSHDSEALKPAYGFGQVFKFRFLLGNKKTYKTNYRGEFNVIFEPFYFKHGYTPEQFIDGYYHMRHIRLQLVLPLTK